MSPMGLLVAELSKVFPVYSSFNTSLASAWIVSNPATDSIHRFFDSSPFSPSNRYIAYTEISLSGSSSEIQNSDLRENKYVDFANVVLVDLRSGSRTLVGKTLAWDSQVGAHVQWGNSDSTLYYNSFGEDLPYDRSYYCFRRVINNRYYRNKTWTLPVGVAYNTYTGEKTVKNCPIYHISPDGKRSASPNLFRISQTQKGYGIPLEQLTQRHKTSIPSPIVRSLSGPSFTDGLYLCRLHGAFCSVDVLLHKLATLAGFDHSTPIFGFHTKWSPDSQLVMFVVRTLEKPVPSKSWFSPEPKRVRVQHLFVVRPERGAVKHVVSWASHPYVSAVTGNVVHLRDGNHPNWVPCSVDPQTSRCSSYKVSMNLRWLVSKRKEPPHWQIVEYDVPPYFASEEGGGVGGNATVRVSKQVRPRVVVRVGTGHPNYHFSAEHGERFIVTDAYEKEKEVLRQLTRVSSARSRSDEERNRKYESKRGEVPLRLIDVRERREVTLLTMNIVRQKSESSSSGGVQWMVDKVLSWGTKKDSSWRCDMHPAWSRDYQWLAINGIPHGDNRQVIIVHVGINITNLF